MEKGREGEGGRLCVSARKAACQLGVWHRRRPPTSTTRNKNNNNSTVAASKLQRHLRACTAAKLAAARRVQPFFSPGANAGSDDDGEGGGADADADADGEQWPPAVAAALRDVLSDPFAKGVAARRLRLVRLMGRARFEALVAKARAAHAALAAAHPRMERVLGGADAEDDAALRAWWLAVDPANPFSGKHARQQASLVANMAAAGLLGDSSGCGGSGDTGGSGGVSGSGDSAGGGTDSSGAAGTVFVELGAGKGWLTAWLAAACGARHLVLLDRDANFTAKADRRLRHAALTRVAVDLADADLAALLAFHRRGSSSSSSRAQCSTAATAGSGNSGNSGATGDKRPEGTSGDAQGAAAQAPPPQLPPPPPLPSPAPWVAFGKHLCGAATDMALRACLKARRREGEGGGGGGGDGDGGGSDDRGGGSGFALRGLAIATCCHHRCGWRAYAGRRQLAALGIGAADFEALVWATGWALCGHSGAAAEGGSGGGDDEGGDGAAGSGDEGGGNSDGGGGDGGREQGADGDEGMAAADGGGGGENGGDGGGGGGGFHPADVFASRAERAAFGLLCKQLIDAGRAARLAAESGGAGGDDGAGRIGPRGVALVEYAPASVTGERTALVWGPAVGAP